MTNTSGCPCRFLANIDTALMQPVFDIAQCKLEPDIHHHLQAQDLVRNLEIAKRAAFCHPMKLRNHPIRLRPISSDSASTGDFNPATALLKIIEALWPNGPRPAGFHLSLPRAIDSGV